MLHVCWANLEIVEKTLPQPVVTGVQVRNDHLALLCQLGGSKRHFFFSGSQCALLFVCSLGVVFITDLAFSYVELVVICHLLSLECPLLRYQILAQ